MVTGCAGFIGSNLVESLLNEKSNVVGVDCFTNYYPISIKKRNIENSLKNKNFEFKKINLLSTNLKEIISDVDFVFHLAAQPGVRAGWKNFKVYIRNNIELTQKLLEACTNSDIKKFIFTSSSSVYGDSPDLPMNEDSLKRPISPYGVTKLATEQICYLYHKYYGVPTIILRYFTVYGPRQRPDMAINRFVSKMFSGETISIFGDGKQTREFTFISDAIDATLLAAKSDYNYEIFNIGSGTRISINNLLALLEKIIGKKPKVKYVEEEKGEMRDTFADISRAKKLLGWTPKVGMEEGLKRYIKWYRGEHHGKT